MMNGYGADLQRMSHPPAGITAFGLATTANRRAIQLSVGGLHRLDERRSVPMMALLEVLSRWSRELTDQ